MTTNASINKRRTLVSWRKTMIRHRRRYHPSQVRYVKKWVKEDFVAQYTYSIDPTGGNQ